MLFHLQSQPFLSVTYIDGGRGVVQLRGGNLDERFPPKEVDASRGLQLQSYLAPVSIPKKRQDILNLMGKCNRMHFGTLVSYQQRMDDKTV